ncbi:MAG: hypothetical protein WAV67_15680, partial [Dokdonella sp.]
MTTGSAAVTVRPDQGHARHQDRLGPEVDPRQDIGHIGCRGRVGQARRLNAVSVPQELQWVSKISWICAESVVLV